MGSPLIRPSAREVPGASRRSDVDDIRLLPPGAIRQRGINDYTPLHMAVAARAALAVQILLDGSADPALRTRIDECETPAEMAAAAGLTDLAAILERKGQPVRKRLRSGLTLLTDIAGTGELVRRQQSYPIRLRMWLNQGEPVRWSTAWGPVGCTAGRWGATLVTEIRADRRSPVSGLFYGVSRDAKWHQTSETRRTWRTRCAQPPANRP
jgi:hypothetical protein